MSSANTTSWSLIQGAARGNSDDREIFAVRYQPVVRAYLSARWNGGVIANDLDDVVQETFSECFREGGVLERVESGRPDGFRAFFLGVVKNVALRYEPREARRPGSLTEDSGSSHGQTTYSIVTDAEPGKVFYWLDDPHRLVQWVPNLIENESLKDTEGKVGSTFRQVYVEHGKHMEMQGVVTAHETNRRLACEMEGDSIGLSPDYRLDDLKKQTRLTQDCTIRFKGFSKVIAFFMSPIIKKSSMKQLEDCFGRLKAKVEESEA